MKYIKKFVLAAIVLMIIATLFVFGNASPAKGPGANIDQAKKDEITDLAKKQFADKKTKGVDMSNGPCLGIVAIGWVVDVAHNPRKPVDEKPENQCSELKNGTVSHFVELDTNGNLIKIQ